MPFYRVSNDTAATPEVISTFLSSFGPMPLCPIDVIVHRKPEWVVLVPPFVETLPTVRNRSWPLRDVMVFNEVERL